MCFTFYFLRTKWHTLYIYFYRRDRLDRLDCLDRLDRPPTGAPGNFGSGLGFGGFGVGFGGVGDGFGGGGGDGKSLCPSG